MTKYLKAWRVISLTVVVVAAGCNQAVSPSGSPAASHGDEGKSQYLLTQEPAGAKGVKEVRKDAKDADEVVVVGRIGGSVKPFVEGRVAFTIVDPSVPTCSERPDDPCATPWDYCCEPKEVLIPATVLVKLVDKDGKAIPVDAEKFLGLKPLQTIVVQGRAKRDADGGSTSIVATGFYVRP
jgi:hypothetical protein